MIQVMTEATEDKSKSQGIVENIFETLQALQQMEPGVGDRDSMGKVVIRVSMTWVKIFAFSCEIKEGFEVNAELGEEGLKEFSEDEMKIVRHFN